MLPSPDNPVLVSDCCAAVSSKKCKFGKLKHKAYLKTALSLLQPNSRNLLRPQKIESSNRIFGMCQSDNCDF